MIYSRRIKAVDDQRCLAGGGTKNYRRKKVLILQAFIPKEYYGKYNSEAAKCTLKGIIFAAL